MVDEEQVNNIYLTEYQLINPRPIRLYVNLLLVSFPGDYYNIYESRRLTKNGKQKIQKNIFEV